MNMPVAVHDPVDTAINIVEGAWEQVPSVRFQVFVPMLKAFETADGRKRLSGVASSTTRDLHGDVMEESALQDMERDANNNLTIFLNHKYDVPDDVAGSVIKAQVIRRGVDQDGEPNWDLDYEIEIDDSEGEDSRPVKAWKKIKSGRKLGLSIGAMIPPGGALRNKKDGTLRVQHIQLLETSIVGIPANQRSWISLAKSAIETEEERIKREAGRLAKASRTTSLGAPTLTLDGETGDYTIRGRLDDITMTNGVDVTSGGTLDPDAEKARVQVITIDTDDPKPSNDDAPPPPSDEGDEEVLSGDPEVTASDAPDVSTDTDGSPVVTASEQSEDSASLLQRALEADSTGEIVRALTAAFSEIDRLERALATEKQARVSAETALAGLQSETSQVLGEVATVVRRLGDLPLTRKSQETANEATLGLRKRLSGVYSDRLLNTIFQEESTNG